MTSDYCPFPSVAQYRHPSLSIRLLNWLHSTSMKLHNHRNKKQTISALRRLDDDALADIGIEAHALNDTPPRIVRIRNSSVAHAKTRREGTFFADA